MCYAGNCNPECGTCRPKRLVVIDCPICGARNSIQREEFLHHFGLPHRMSIMEKKMLERGMDYSMECISCGHDLTQDYKDSISPKPCKRVVIVCGFPCGRCVEEPTGANGSCNTAVPLGRL